MTRNSLPPPPNLYSCVRPDLAYRILRERLKRECPYAGLCALVDKLIVEARIWPGGGGSANGSEYKARRDLMMIWMVSL